MQVTVNPQDLTGGPAMKEQGYGNNSLTAAVTLASSQNNASIVAANAYLEYVQGSYKGETGSFRGLEPIFLSFAIRNSGNSPKMGR